MEIQLSPHLTREDNLKVIEAILDNDLILFIIIVTISVVLSSTNNIYYLKC